MPDFRRYYIPEAVIFITCVTQGGQPLLANDIALERYWQILHNVQEIHPFHLYAYALLPDHFHWLLHMPEGELNFSKVIQSFKWNYTLEYKKLMGLAGKTACWQPRFWDHVIRTEKDLERHMDYIHYNPIKHGYSDQMNDANRSSYHFWYEKGYYSDGIPVEIIEQDAIRYGE